MKKLILLILAILVLVSCQRNNDDDTIIDDTNSWEEVCDYKTTILSPEGFELNTISEIDFNGSVKVFQFVDEQIGFAMLGNNVGGYVEVFKTTDGGQTWDNLNIGIDKIPRSMIFRDENFGIITVHDITGCPPPNCQNKCVILKTENGGLGWEEVEIENLKGMLYHPQFDDEDNLYATLYLNNQSVIVKSMNNGENWDTLFYSPELDIILPYSFEIFQDKIYASAKDERLLVISTDGQLTKAIAINDTHVWDLALIDEDNLVMAASEKVIKTTNGGDTWETIYDETARIIGFDSAEKGLMLLQKSSCPNDIYQVNDLIASTNNGGLNWGEAEETTTNLKLHFSNSQRMGNGIWYFMIGNELMEIKEN